MFNRSIPLSLQLLLTFVSVIAGSTAVLTLAAYHSSRTTLELEARNRVSVAAENRAATLQRLLQSRQRRADGFLATLDPICGETGRPGAISWELGCVQKALEEFRATERAAGAVLWVGPRLVAMSGRPIAPTSGLPGALAELVRMDGEYRYVMRAEAQRVSLAISFGLDDLRPFFEDRSGLGKGGEVFLAAADGEFLTPPLYSESSTPPGADVAEPVAECLDGPGVRTDIDYRGQRTIHGYRPVPSLIGAGCIDAHLPYDEALAPAEGLRAALVARGIVFVAIGVLLSLLAAQWIAAPVRRLAVSARALEAGDFDRSIRISGPSEVRALGRAFSASARSIAQLVTREQAARREAESANRAKDDFLATVSHELRTPLTAMLGWARLLQQGRLDAVGARRAAAAIERSAHGQARLVDDLLDISRIVAGRLRLKRTPIALSSPVEAAVDSVRPLAADRRVRIEVHLEEPSPSVFGDAQRLQQIVSNLLTNAVKFTPAEGRISLALRTVGGRAEITVSDTGAGISPEFLPYVFERFRQADGAITRSHGGLGLGLAIVRHLVKLHGGDVAAHSEGEGRGATFTVLLPRYEGQPPAIVRTTGGRKLAIDSRPLSAVSVLVVDDDAETLDVVKAILEHAGADVETVTSASEARVALAKHLPSVVISDIGMPVEDGYSLMRSIRDSEQVVPAIALTAYARREDAEEAHAAGFQVHMAKPVDAHDLVDAVAALASPAGHGA